MTSIQETKQWLGHPRGLFTLFFTEMWERFSYYGMRAILILFMTTDTAMRGLGLDHETATSIIGLYLGSVYLLTLPGGWVADNLLGQRKAIWYGGISIMMGHLILAIPGSPGIFYSGLAFIAIGTGLLKPNISSIVGDLYPEGGAKRDAGFSIFYMGINLGSILGQTIVAYLGEKVDWHLGFGMAAVGMFFGLLQFRLSQRHLGDAGLTPKAKEAQAKGNSFGKNIVSILGFTGAMAAFLALLHFTGVVDLRTARGVASSAGYIIVLITLLYFAYIVLFGGLNTVEKKKSIVILLLFAGAAIFWAGFEQAASSLNLFAKHFTDLFVFGVEVPAGWAQNFNPLFIVIFAPVIGALWVKLAAKQLNPNTPIKFALGILLMSLGFLVMYFAAQGVASGQKAGMIWLVFTYFLHTMGELCLSPIGLSATTKLAPRKFYSQMMGIWFVGAALGNLLAGLYAGEMNIEDPKTLPEFFSNFFWVATGAALIFFALSPWLKKWIADSK